MQPIGPTALRHETAFIDPRSGRLSDHGKMFLEQMWRQLSAGFPIVPVTITGTNDLTLTPTLGGEGAASYGNYMAWVGVAANTSTGAVTGHVASDSKTLATVKIYKTAGAAQAGAGDLVAGSLYLFIYNSALDTSAGGLVLK